MGKRNTYIHDFIFRESFKDIDKRFPENVWIHHQLIAHENKSREKAKTIFFSMIKLNMCFLWVF